jgi:hypothetical protein
MNAPTLAILIVCFASVALAEDFKTINGKEYKNATVSRVEPDGIVLRTKSGISKVYFVELPKDVQQRFHYDAAKANAYSAEQLAAVTNATKPAVTTDAVRPVPISGIEALPHTNPITATAQVVSIGAVCRDGTASSAVGRGACSHHGGVQCWKMSDGTYHQ